MEKGKLSNDAALSDSILLEIRVESHAEVDNCGSFPIAHLD
jgi:hypothetical protein